MSLTDRLTRILLGTMTLGAVLVPATVAAADPPDGGGGEITTPTTDPCQVGPCLPPEPPDPECPPFVATCGDLTSNPCNPVEEDCSPGPEPCEQDADCPDPNPEPEPEPEPEVHPTPEPVDPSVPAVPNFTG